LDHAKYDNNDLSETIEQARYRLDWITKKLDVLFVRVDCLNDRIKQLERSNATNHPQALDLSDNQLRLLVDYLNKRVCYLEEQHGDRLIGARQTTTTTTQPGVHETDAGHGDGAK
jgi:hypothetical protein